MGTQGKLEADSGEAVNVKRCHCPSSVIRTQFGQGGGSTCTEAALDGVADAAVRLGHMKAKLTIDAKLNHAQTRHGHSMQSC